MNQKHIQTISKSIFQYGNIVYLATLICVSIFYALSSYYLVRYSASLASSLSTSLLPVLVLYSFSSFLRICLTATTYLYSSRVAKLTLSATYRRLFLSNLLAYPSNTTKYLSALKLQGTRYQAFIQGLFQFVSLIPTFVLVIVSIAQIIPLRIYPIIAAILIIILPLVAIYLKALKYFIIKSRVTEEAHFESVNAYISSFRDIRAFNLVDTSLNRLDDLTDSFLKSTSWRSITTFSLQPGLELFFVLVVLAIITATGQLKPITDVLSIITPFIFAYQKIAPISFQIFSFFSELKLVNQSIPDLLEILSADTCSDFVLPSLSQTTQSASAYLRICDLKWGHLTPLFPNNTLSLTLRSSESLLVTGESGSGKSSLIDVLLGFLPPLEGRIFTTATDYQSSKSGLLNQFTYLSSHSQLLGSSLLEAITLDKYFDCADLTRLRCLLERLSLLPLNDFTTSSFRKYLTSPLFSSRLSSGQKQRILIARSLYNLGDFNIFDEPTSHLDHKNKNQCLNAILEECSPFGLIYISHDPVSSSRFTYHLKLSRNNFTLSRNG